MAKKSKKAKAKAKSVRLKIVPKKDYCFAWDALRENCVFQHKSGKGGAVGCGAMDSVSVFSRGDALYVLSVNYPTRYVCIETFSDGNGADGAIFASTKDITKRFGNDFASYSPKEIAEHFVAEMA